LYGISSSVLIKDTKKTPSSDMGMLSEVGGFGSMGTNSIENEIEIFKSKKMMHDVVVDMGLQTWVTGKFGLKDRELYGKESPIIVQLISEKPYDEPIEGPLEVKLKGDKIDISSEGLPQTI